ncbi:guanine nucleotide-binding protein subunit gamma 2-like isoform X2 [Apium graveolens]|uniref:guanine nucleotide-binding protein subunit gamma 2-like isoform X2 n=1 Tax=Apium graveolens TaxID=4045 RepID=UPI003D7BF9AB
MDPLTTEGAGNADDVEKANENSTRTPAQSLPNFVGKHRMTAAISLLNQQIQFLQEEIDQLDTFGGSSIVCKELIASVESNSDALLPVTKGPTEVAWERWFQRARSSKNLKKWI